MIVGLQALFCCTNGCQPSPVNDGRFAYLGLPGGGLSATGVPLKFLIMEAYNIRAFQVSGEPDWETKEMPVYAVVVERGGSKLRLHTGEPPPPGQRIRQGRGMFSVKKGGTALLTAQLERQLSRVVIDRTGLTGEYDYTLEWTPEPGQGGAESLGLKLESQKRPVGIIVIERVEKPSEN